MASQSTEDMKRWQPGGLEHADLFLISINPAWLLNEFPRKKKAKEKRHAPKLTLP